MTMMVDTGSADLYDDLPTKAPTLPPQSLIDYTNSWLHGPNAPSPAGVPGAPLLTGETFHISNGSATDIYQAGIGLSTTIAVGNLRIKNLTVGITTEDGFKNDLDGMLGLAFRRLNSCASPIPRVLGCGT